MASTSSPQRDAPPHSLKTLAARFDPGVIDVPGGKARIRLEVRGRGGTGGPGDRDDDNHTAYDAHLVDDELHLQPVDPGAKPDALLAADAQTWQRIADDLRGGMDAFRQGRLRIRHSLHLGVGFLAATSGSTDPGRLRFERVKTKRETLSILTAGTGDPVLCLHGLGGTKSSFLPTVAALADRYRVIAVDLPGFGESDKPVGAAYDAPYFARATGRLLTALDIDQAHLIGNSMGGRVAIEVGLSEPDRARKLALLCPALAWLRDRPLRALLQLPLPLLGLVQPTPRQIAEPVVRRLIGSDGGGWTDTAVDEFLRAYLTPRGRAAFYAAARNIYLDEPHGDDGFWTRLAALSPDALFVWGRRDPIIPIAFMRHVERTLPQARHVELDCGHVPQVERPRETHQAIREFLARA